MIFVTDPKIYDPIRCKKVAGTPEERVRQALLRQMLDFLSFPKGLISVEKKLGTSLRRVDIVVYRKVEGDLIPLLLVECKASPVDEEAAFRQAAGYRALVADKMYAPFWCLAHASGIRTFWLEGNEQHSVPFLPPYPQLLKTIS
jgi:hypothetical protein